MAPLNFEKQVSSTIKVTANSDNEAKQKVHALEQLSTLQLKDLQWLAQASKKPGIDKKLQMAKKFI